MKVLASTLLAFNFAFTSAQQQQPMRPHFEVVSVRPTGNDQEGGPSVAQAFRDARRVRISGGSSLLTSPDSLRLIDWPLLDLVAAAYEVPLAQVSGPAWLGKNAQGFNVTARVPVGSSDHDVRLMLQSMLQERFSLQVHSSMHMAAGYELVVSKGGPKLRSATVPTSSQQLSEAESQQQISQQLADTHKAMAKAMENGDATGASIYRSWPSINLDDFANQLALLANKPITNKTHLVGKYVIRLTLSQGGDGPEANLSDAVKELGLLLVPVKVLVTGVVVDLVNKLPTEN